MIAIIQNQVFICLYFTKVNTKIFPVPPTLPLISSVGLSANTQKIIFMIICMKE